MAETVPAFNHLTCKHPRPSRLVLASSNAHQHSICKLWSARLPNHIMYCILTALTQEVALCSPIVLPSHITPHVTDSIHACLSPGRYSFVKISASLWSLSSSKVPALPDRRSSKLALLPSTCTGCGLERCHVSEQCPTQCIRKPSPQSEDNQSNRAFVPAGSYLHK